jgi:hypothetical protein
MFEDFTDEQLWHAWNANQRAVENASQELLSFIEPQQKALQQELAERGAERFEAFVACDCMITNTMPPGEAVSVPNEELADDVRQCPHPAAFAVQPVGGSVVHCCAGHLPAVLALKGTCLVEPL